MQLFLQTFPISSYEQTLRMEYHLILDIQIPSITHKWSDIQRLGHFSFLPSKKILRHMQFDILFIAQIEEKCNLSKISICLVLRAATERRYAG